MTLGGRRLLLLLFRPAIKLVFVFLAFYSCEAGEKRSRLREIFEMSS